MQLAEVGAKGAHYTWWSRSQGAKEIEKTEQTVAGEPGEHDGHAMEQRDGMIYKWFTSDLRVIWEFFRCVTGTVHVAQAGQRVAANM